MTSMQEAHHMDDGRRRITITHAMVFIWAAKRADQFPMISSIFMLCMNTSNKLIIMGRGK